MSRTEDISQLITNHHRRLQKLKEKQALYGLETPVHLEIEIEDIETVLANLQAEQTLSTERGAATGSPPKALSPSVPSQPLGRAVLFVGRQTQLEALSAYWESTIHHNQGQVIFLTGEAGIGKTTLAQEFSRRVLERYPQARYAAAQSDQVAGDISPYAPFIQILNSLTEQAVRRGNNWTTEYLREVGPDILEMIPVAGPLLAATVKTVDFVWRRQRAARLGDADRSQFGQQDIFQQFTDTIRNIARNKNPLLLFIDDWHWADTSSTNLLFHLARQLHDAPVLLLASYRPHDAQVREHPILTIQAELTRYQLCHDLPLDFLSRPEVEQYLAHRFPTSKFEAHFIDELLKITSGNALFISEYLNLLVNEGRLTPDGQFTGDLSQLSPPENVEAVIRTRLGYLDRETRDMLAYGSVEGEQFTTLVLSHLLEVKPLLLIRKLRAIEETHDLIASLGQQSIYDHQTTVYRFVHTLIYRTLYNLLEEQERIEINRLLLELLGTIYERADAITQARLAPELMAHAAEAENYLAQARYALVAAEEAAKNHAHAEAVKQYSTGLHALDKLHKSTFEADVLRLDLLVGQGQVEDFSGAQQQAVATFRQAEVIARSRADQAKVVQILNNLGPVLRHLGNYGQAQHCYEESVFLAEQLGDQAGLARAYHNLGYAYAYGRSEQYVQALECYQKSLTILELLGDKAGIARAYDRIGRIYRSLNEYKQALNWLYQAVEINKKLDNKSQLARNYNSIGVCYTDLGDYQTAINWCKKALIIWQQIGYRRGEALAGKRISIIYDKQGDYEQALKWCQEALAIQKNLDDRPGMAWSYDGIARAYLGKNDSKRAIEAYLQAIIINQEMNDKIHLAWNYYRIGLIYQNLEKYTEAYQYYQKAIVIRENLGNKKHIIETHQRIAEIESELAKSDKKE
ncbi:MAG: tetratricopeptide repeat protein [Anaerolineae bacterium]|nr:tetratricopeptide repeat protein [Anaerolineae bacterium]